MLAPAEASLSSRLKTLGIDSHFNDLGRVTLIFSRHDREQGRERQTPMEEVTAEMIQRGRGGDPVVAVERRRVARRVREAREKLTSSGSGLRAFDLELLRLYATRRRNSTLGIALLALAFALVASQWAARPLLLGWLGVNTIAILAGRTLADRFMKRHGVATVGVDVRRWSRMFVASETVQGCLWAMIVVSGLMTHNPQAQTFILITLCLVTAVNATIVAPLPAAVYASLLPITLAMVGILRPFVAPFALNDALLAGLLLSIQAAFVYLARSLHAAALQPLVFQAEKDELIAELEESKANSDLARRRAEESNLAKSHFLATMSHELRTPLNAILGFSEVMKAELFGRHAVAAYKDYSTDIHSSGEHLLMLINEILDLSRVEAGRYDLLEASIDLEAIVEECVHLVALKASKKTIALRIEPGEMLARLWADERAVRQVVLNLLSNAIKFTPQGGRVTITMGMADGGGQVLSITDTGAGIAEHEIPIVMSSFGRGALAQKTAEEGSGLGLPIVKGLVELHGGTFELISKIRQGTTVKVLFPPERVMSVLPRLEFEAAAPSRDAVTRPMRSAA